MQTNSPCSVPFLFRHTGTLSQKRQTEPAWRKHAQTNPPDKQNKVDQKDLPALPPSKKAARKRCITCQTVGIPWYIYSVDSPMHGFLICGGNKILLDSVHNSNQVKGAPCGVHPRKACRNSDHLGDGHSPLMSGLDHDPHRIAPPQPPNHSTPT